MTSTLSSMLEKLSFLTQRAWPILLSTSLISYLTLVHFLRYNRVKRTTSRFSHQIRSGMPLSTAFRIHNSLVELEFPAIFSTATTFALFKAYGIPSISSLLVSTHQLSGPPLASSKRYADTGALLLEAVLNEPGAERSVEAIARINYLHDRWRGKVKGGIRDEDMLYTLSLFALEPMRWVKQYEWRELSEVEVCALGTWWKYLGDGLKVPFNELPGFEKGWENGLQWMEELSAWSVAYEKKSMVPAKSNAVLAEATLKIILWKVPKWMHGFGRRLFATVMEGSSPRLREAMLYALLTPPLLPYHP